MGRDESEPTLSSDLKDGLLALQHKFGCFGSEISEEPLCQLLIRRVEAAFNLLATHLDQCKISALLRTIQTFTNMIELHHAGKVTLSGCTGQVLEFAQIVSHYTEAV